MIRASLARFLVRRFAIACVLILIVTFARAGGPKYVAGTSFFTGGTPGHPITWANGSVTYYTDQGNLSPLLDGPDADSFVADAFARWTAPPSVALIAVHGGQLSEDVSGQNVIRNPDSCITMPADIQPTATNKPVGVVYDYDGTVTDALLGTGAGDSDQCFTNAAFGGVDAFSVTGNFAHALIVLNGNCIQQSSDQLEVKYRLMRVLGTVLGLDWSQLNLNVITGQPKHPSADDQAGFPLMHAIDPPQCVPITLCYPDPADLKMDDRASISRLYPVTAANVSQFPGKVTLADHTARIYGTVTFTAPGGSPIQGMQAVNVIARWINPSTGQPSGQYAASSVSGFLFRGNSGSAITGSSNPAGQAYSQFGSTDATLEGFFDLGGLELPSGAPAQYQLSVEAIDPLWSPTVGPYQPNQVAPSGSFSPVLVQAALGANLEQDAPMLCSAQPMQDDGGNLGWSSPLPTPPSGRWGGDLGSYADIDYFWMNAQPNRTMTVDITATDETGLPSQQKARPMIGMWSMSDPQGSPPEAVSLLPFNSGTSTTRLNVQVLTSGPLRIGVADLRGDGRPDFTYLGRVLYGDSVAPTRLSVRGGTPFILQGLGFQPGLTVSIGNTEAPVLAAYPNQILATSPPLPDGVQSVTIQSPADGAYSSLINVLTFGAAATDTMQLTQSNPAIPVGGQTPNPIRVSVNASDGITPVDGATVQWSVNNNATLSLCGASTCRAITDESGHSETRVTVGASGTTTVVAQLAPAAYPNKQVQTTLTSSLATKSISLSPMKIWGTQGMSLSIPLTARVLNSLGVPVPGVTLNFSTTAGVGTLSPSSATTGNDGYAYSTLQIASLQGEVDAVVCAAGGGIPCSPLSVFQVAISALHLQPVSGAQQAIFVGQSFTPLRVRVLDSANPPNPVFGVPILFKTTFLLPQGNAGGGGTGSEPIGHNPERVIVGSSQTAVTSDSDGYAAIIPPNGGASRPLEVDVATDPGNGAALSFQLQILPQIPSSLEATTFAETSNFVHVSSWVPVLALPDISEDSPSPGDAESSPSEDRHHPVTRHSVERSIAVSE
jgi:Bacterial Ig-like domain (group 1)/IPT/TIG domain